MNQSYLGKITRGDMVASWTMDVMQDFPPEDLVIGEDGGQLTVRRVSGHADVAYFRRMK